MERTDSHDKLGAALPGKRGDALQKLQLLCEMRALLRTACCRRFPPASRARPSRSAPMQNGRAPISPSRSPKGPADPSPRSLPGPRAGWLPAPDLKSGQIAPPEVHAAFAAQGLRQQGLDVAVGCLRDLRRYRCRGGGTLPASAARVSPCRRGRIRARAGSPAACRVRPEKFAKVTPFMRRDSSAGGMAWAREEPNSTPSKRSGAAS